MTKSLRLASSPASLVATTTSRWSCSSFLSCTSGSARRPSISSHFDASSAPAPWRGTNPWRLREDEEKHPPRINSFWAEPPSTKTRTVPRREPRPPPPERPATPRRGADQTRWWSWMTPKVSREQCASCSSLRLSSNHRVPNELRDQDDSSSTVWRIPSTDIQFSVPHSLRPRSVRALSNDRAIHEAGIEELLRVGVDHVSQRGVSASRSHPRGGLRSLRGRERAARRPLGSRNCEAGQSDCLRFV